MKIVVEYISYVSGRLHTKNCWTHDKPMASFHLELTMDGNFVQSCLNC